MSIITMIDTSKLYHHPLNRKNLGDLTELAQSIRQNGIYQNLTVVPFEPADHGALQNSETNENFEPGEVFMVVIGNRRLEAAKMAELPQLPCVVSDMDLRGQLRAMAEENMHRKDMTPLEEAENFQMLIDLGDTVESLSRKSGVSESTVRNRLKLTELDRESLVEAEERGGTMRDYMELSKIKDVSKRNAVLEKVGTPDFRLELNNALKEQSNAEHIEEWISVADSFAERKYERDNTTMAHVETFSTYWDYRPMAIPEDADTVKYMYTVDGANVMLFRPRVIKEKTPEKIAEAAAFERREAENIELKKFARNHHDLRVEFVTGLAPSVAKKHIGDIVAFWGEQLRGRMEGNFHYMDVYITNRQLCKALGIQLTRGQKAPTKEQWTEAAYRCPEYAFFVWAVLGADKTDLLYHSYMHHNVDELHPYAGQYNDHYPNEVLVRIYDLLCKMGYTLSEQERQLLDGTHPYLVREPVKKQTDASEEPGADPNCVV